MRRPSFDNAPPPQLGQDQKSEASIADVVTSPINALHHEVPVEIAYDDPKQRDMMKVVKAHEDASKNRDIPPTELARLKAEAQKASKEYLFGEEAQTVEAERPMEERAEVLTSLRRLKSLNDERRGLSNRWMFSDKKEEKEKELVRDMTNELGVIGPKLARYREAVSAYDLKKQSPSTESQEFNRILKEVQIEDQSLVIMYRRPPIVTIDLLPE